MLRLEALEVIQRFRKPGGHDFAIFCNKIIRASCWAGSIPQSEVWTTSRSDAKDKGVDTRVGKGIVGDKSGYFGAPSIWQFKAADESNVGEADMEKEVNKPRAKQWIEEGNAYRLCICAHLTPDKKQTLLDALIEAVAAINVSAPEPKILSVDDVVELANSFPALVLEYRPGLDEKILLFESWKHAITSITPTFVASSGFDKTRSTVLKHVSLEAQTPSALMTLYGSAGAGKTRATFECLQDLPMASSLCLYLTSEDDARDVANMLANDGSAHAIIIADECSLEMAEQLSRTLIGCRRRIRCLCIDNSAERASTPSPELLIPNLTSAELEKVLAANFPSVSPDRLRAYAQYCDGSVRLAADMCAHFDAEIAQTGTMSSALGRTGEYYRSRLAEDEQRKAVEAISLLKRVRHKGDAPTALDLLSELTGVRRDEIEAVLRQIKDSPGWVEKGALYYRVTPDLIAMTAFAQAWDRWARGDEDGFLQRIPPTIQESFLQRVSESASREVRETVQRFFRRFADDFSPRDLGEVRLVNRFVSLIDTDSSLYLPALRRAVESATADELKAGEEWLSGSWGPRRQLVWTAERFALFPEHFRDCEAILFTLARNESEPEIGNNATKTWQTLFRMQLSGTSLPLDERLAMLRDRLSAAGRADAELFSGAFRKILDLWGSRLLGPPVVGGRVPPPEWFPNTWDERRKSVNAALSFLNNATQHNVPEIARAARRALVSDVEVLARNGWLDQLRPFVKGSHLDESDKAKLVSILKQFVAWGRNPDDSDIKADYRTKIEAWVSEISPRSLHARLVESVGSDSVTHFQREQQWESELGQLAAELLASSSLASELDWLTSEDAKGGFEFGQSVGKLDRSAMLIDQILQHSRGRFIGFARGYVAGLLYGASVDPEVVNARLNELEKGDPAYSFQIALAGGTHVSAFDRGIRLIESGIIHAYYLRNFTYWVGNVRVTNEQVLKALRVLLPIAVTDSGASEVMVDFLGARFHGKQLQTLLDMDRNLVWQCIVTAAKNPGRETFWLKEVLTSAAPTNWPVAISIACEALVGDNFDFERDAGSLLGFWAQGHPEEVMDGIGRLMLDDKVGWKFFASKFGVFHSIPVDVTIKWLESAGVEGARKIARHLPRPFLDASGAPTVPELTAFVLSRFEHDQATFREFCAGTHSFQMYVGDIAAQKERESALARPFFNHPLKRIREWARWEYDSGLRDAQQYRELEDEQGFSS